MTPQRTIAHYRITAKLGEGGMGEVWRATDTKLGRSVAIKVLPEAFAEDADRMARFTREAQVLASLNHPNIAAIYGVEERALVMELVEGHTLAERIAQGAMSVEEATPIIEQLIDALEYAHEKGVVHRDLKPANIKITPEGRLKVLDFGLAKALAGETAAADPASSPTLTMRATMAGVIMGTAGYMSPEQARGQSVDKRADIWAFGVVVYEMLTGRQLFGGPTVSDTLAAVLTKEPPWDLVPEPMRRLVRTCLMKDARRRMRDIGDARLLMNEPSLAQIQAAPRWNLPLAILAGICALAAIAGWSLHLREAPQEAAPLRFQVYPPEKMNFSGSAMALSPDGRQLAFTVLKESQSSLWIRALDSLDAREISGAEGAIFLFWSADSRYLGFSAGGKLKKVEVGLYGYGAPQTICEMSGFAAASGSWNRDGTILFGTQRNGLFRVSQAGGVPTRVPVITPGQFLAADQSAAVRPGFLPDGKHFLYFQNEQRSEDSGIYLASLDSNSRRRLVNSMSGGIYAPPSGRQNKGHLLYLRDKTLMAEPLDSVSYNSAGEPFPVAESVGENIAQGWFSASNNGVLAYRTGGAIFRLTWFDRAGKKLGVFGPPAEYASGGDVALSHDGKLLAMSSRQHDNRDIWLMDVARGIPTRFTSDPATEGYPVWSPDGSQLVFSSNREGIDNLYRKATGNTGAEEPLLKSDRQKRAFDWSADGKYLLYSVSDPKSNFDLWVLPFDDPRKPVPYLTGSSNETQGQFSPTPTGSPRWVAYSSDESGRYEIYVQAFPTPMRQYRISDGGGEEPRWSGDGKELYYASPDGRLMAAEVKTAPQFEVVGSPKPLFRLSTFTRGTNQRTFRWAPAPDGQRFLVLSEPEEMAGAPITVILNWEAAVKR